MQLIQINRTGTGEKQYPAKGYDTGKYRFGAGSKLRATF
jgi:hypothetical protein